MGETHPILFVGSLLVPLLLAELALTVLHGPTVRVRGGVHLELPLSGLLARFAQFLQNGPRFVHRRHDASPEWSDSP